MRGRTATGLAAGLRARELSVRELTGSEPRADRRRQPERQRDRHAADEPGLALQAGTRPTQPGAARYPARAADRGQGPRGDGGDANHFRLAAVRRDVPEHDSLRRRAATSGRRDGDRQDQHAGVRRRIADLQPRLRAHPEPARPRAALPAAPAAARRPRSRPAWSRSPTAPTSAASVRNPASFCGLVGLRPTPGRTPDARPGRPLAAAVVHGPTRARRARPQPSARPSPAPGRAIRCRSEEPFSGRSLEPVDRPADRLELRRGRWPADRPRGDDGARGAPGDAGDVGRIVEESPSRTSTDRRPVLRGAARRGVPRGVRRDRRRGPADAGRDPAVGLSLAPSGISPRSGCAGRCSRGMRESSNRYDVSAVPATQSRRASRGRSFPPRRGRRMGSYLEWLRAAADHRQPPPRSAAVSAGLDGPTELLIGPQLDRPYRDERATAAAGARDPPERRARGSELAALVPWPARPRSRRTAPPTPDAEPRPFWLATPARGDAAADRRDRGRPVHRRRRLHRAVGGAARQGRRPGARRRPARGRARSASARAGRNGGFVVGSLTHGLENGLARFADEMPPLERLGAENFDGLAPTSSARHRLRPRADRRAHRRARAARGRRGSRRRPSCCARFGHDVEVLDGAAMRAEVASPTYLGGALGPHRRGARRPGQARRRACATRRCRAGVRIHERTAATSARATRGGGGRRCSTPPAARSARRASCWRPAPTRRCCGRCAATSRRSTTTC